jgi:hypothetical protein
MTSSLQLTEIIRSPVGGYDAVTISGHFDKGKIASFRTNAVVGTFSSEHLRHFDSDTPRSAAGL